MSSIRRSICAMILGSTILALLMAGGVAITEMMLWMIERGDAICSDATTQTCGLIAFGVFTWAGCTATAVLAIIAIFTILKVEKMLFR